MKNLSLKEKILFIITVVFIFVALVANIRNFKNQIIHNEVNNNVQKNTKEIGSNVDFYILRLWDTLGEAIRYLEVNIDDKGKASETYRLVDDSIIALTSIEYALNKNSEDAFSKLILCTRDAKNGFIKLRELLENDSKNTIEKEKILKKIEQKYEEGKKDLRVE